MDKKLQSPDYSLLPTFSLESHKPVGTGEAPLAARRLEASQPRPACAIWMPLALFLALAGAAPPTRPTGPPPRTTAQKAVDWAFETAFPMLYAFENEGMLDSSKNLRVLWTRALLANANLIDDDVATKLLPTTTSWVVGKPFANTIWQPVLPKLTWIKQRTEFIDQALDRFLEDCRRGPRPQVVLLGAGYDTRALRYRNAGAGFYEIDLETVVDVKGGMVRRFFEQVGGECSIRTLALDFNKFDFSSCSPFDLLVKNHGLDQTRPTLIVCEALLFYLAPPAKRALMSAASSFIRENSRSKVVLVDNLAPFVTSPLEKDAADFLNPLGMELGAHASLWGGAIQFLEVTSNHV